MTNVRILFLYFLCLLWGISCRNNPKDDSSETPAVLFTPIPASHSNIKFINTIQQDINFNFIEYPYIYTGGGVAVGDINNDGLEDIYFSSNQHANALYLNKGDFRFEDITQTAGVSDNEGWTTGVNMIDINNDGLLDIYVCKSASLNDPERRKNKLFINQGNATFKEEAEKWGLDHFGFSIQSYFFDYDRDGDLDMYLVNHRPDFLKTRLINSKTNPTYFRESSDHLFRNDGDTFTNVTIPARVQNKAWGLSASIGDFNGDDWPDIYVANDYIQPDHLYINNRNGTFSDQILHRFRHISYNSMGSDYADLNNDLLPDLIVLDMLAEDHSRSKENMASMNTEGFWLMVNSGYHYTYMVNMLHINNGNGTFNEIGQLSGIAKTDWSWAPLIADFDNDGYNDIFVTNGIERDLANQDYLVNLNKKIKEKVPMKVSQIENMIPSNKLANYMFRNKGDLSFEKTTEAWGLGQKVNSNGAAYADLDNDGDLDLVLNNQSDTAMVYRNNSRNNYIALKLTGNAKNSQAVGAKIRLFTANTQQYRENYPVRGYQSSVASVLNFGLGDEEKAERIEITWPDNTTSVLNNVKANQILTVDKNKAKTEPVYKWNKEKKFQPVASSALGIDFIHKENDYNDFQDQVLLPQKQSTQGPALAVADVNNDGMDDFYIGGAKDQSPVLYLQQPGGTFKKSNIPLFDRDKKYEDQGALFFDMENDGDPDLYVTSGGYEFSENSPLLQDRLYINDGKGNFKRSNGLPKMYSATKKAAAFDFDSDGDEDLFVGGQVVPRQYPLSSYSYVLRNDNGRYSDVTGDIAPEFKQAGLVNDLIFSDYDNDGTADLIVVGEWMPLTFFKNEAGRFKKAHIPDLAHTEGWWNTVTATDIDKDGDEDYLIGNLGHNNKFHPTAEKPLHIYGNYFDDNASFDMVLSKDYKGNLVPVRGKECSSQQTPFLSEKFQTYKAFASATLDEIYGTAKLEDAYHQKVHTFSSVLLINNGNGSFAVKALPNPAQTGPTMAFEIIDINKDGHADILGIGAIHEAEVETIRYDGNTGYILLGDSKGNFKADNDDSFFIAENAKHMNTINIAGETHLLIANNNGPLKIFKVKP